MDGKTDRKFYNETKIQKVINNILDKEATFRGHWSSATNFEGWLKEDGFIPPCEISHQYKFPDGIPEEMYEKMVMNNMYYLGGFRPLRIENPEQYVEFVYQGVPGVSAQEKQELLDYLNGVTGELNEVEKRKVIMHFTNPENQSVALQNIKNMVREIKQLNPVLANVSVDSLEDANDLLIGVTSRFHPDDINYFITTKKTDGLDKIRQDQEPLKSALGYGPNLFVAPSRISQIVNGIQMQRQNKMQNNGHFDR